MTGAVAARRKHWAASGKQRRPGRARCRCRDHGTLLWPEAAALGCPRSTLHQEGIPKSESPLAAGGFLQ